LASLATLTSCSAVLLLVELVEQVRVELFRNSREHCFHHFFLHFK